MLSCVDEQYFVSLGQLVEKKKMKVLKSHLTLKTAYINFIEQ